MYILYSYKSYDYFVDFTKENFNSKHPKLRHTHHRCLFTKKEINKELPEMAKMGIT